MSTFRRTSTLQRLELTEVSESVSLTNEERPLSRSLHAIVCRAEGVVVDVHGRGVASCWTRTKHLCSVHGVFGTSDTGKTNERHSPLAVFGYEVTRKYSGDEGDGSKLECRLEGDIYLLSSAVHRQRHLVVDCLMIALCGKSADTTLHSALAVDDSEPIAEVLGGSLDIVPSRWPVSLKNAGQRRGMITSATVAEVDESVEVVGVHLNITTYLPTFIILVISLGVVLCSCNLFGSSFALSKLEGSNRRTVYQYSA